MHYTITKFIRIYSGDSQTTEKTISSDMFPPLKKRHCVVGSTVTPVAIGMYK